MRIRRPSSKRCCAGVRRAADPGRFVVEPDRRQAIRWALGEARAGDVVVIAGKAMRNTRKSPASGCRSTTSLEARRALSLRCRSDEPGALRRRED